MYKPVYVPFAVTQHGERVEPKTATQEDYDTLLCEFCRLKISVVIDELTGVKSFVHTPLRLEATMRLTTCPYNKTASKFGDGQKAEYIYPFPVPDGRGYRMPRSWPDSDAALQPWANPSHRYALWANQYQPESGGHAQNRPCSRRK